MSASVGEGTQTWGEQRMLIPESDYYVLLVLLNELGVNSKDPEEQTIAWEKFWNSPLADQWRIARSPNQVARSHQNRIIIK